ncbi:MAG: AMP-binding protein [Myxococcales bacterium]|nr:AMP-binding protein [Myxococcales bacterium]
MQQPSNLSYRHVGGQEPLMGKTIDAMFREVAATYPDHDAFVSIPQQKRLTYAALDLAVEEVAKALVGLGMSCGDRVGIWATDNAEWLLLQLATARVGVILVNINPSYRTEELGYALELAQVQALFLIPAFRSSQYVEMVHTICPEVAECTPQHLQSKRFPFLKHLIVYQPEHPLQTQCNYTGFWLWQDFLAQGKGISSEDVAARGCSVDMDDPINIQFTSGTTGFPKAVVLTHHNILNNGYFIGQAMGFSAKDRLCVPVPFYHCFGMVVSNLACLTHGAAIVVPADHFEAGATLHAIEVERCTAVHGVPTMFIAELEELEKKSYDLSSLRTGIMAGAPCPEAIVRRVMEEMGCREILIAYGQTEASPVTHITHPEDTVHRRVETVGTNMPHTEVKVVSSQTGEILPVGETGEICFRGYQVMREYFDQPEATAKTIDEKGWLHSGDLGTLDQDGYLRITGRLKDMIIRGGENIYPAEIEAFFHKHPDVSDVAVFGVPDPKMGEEVGAWVRLKEGAVPDPSWLRDFAKDKIAHFKVPRYFWFVESYPMTVTGKIQKFRMRDVVQTWFQEGTQDIVDKREETEM